MPVTIAVRAPAELKDYLDSQAIAQSKPGNMVSSAEVLRKLILKDMAEKAKEEKQAA